LQSQEASHLSFFSIDDDIFGHPYKYWVQRYFENFTASYKKKLKEKHVFCLSGALEDRTAMRKDFDIPQDKAILMSPIKYVSAMKTEKFKREPEQRDWMLKKVEKEIDIIQDMNLFIDWNLMSSECIRCRTDFFTIDNGNIVVLAEGYWLFLKPNVLSKGLHDVRTFSSCKLGKVQIPQEYHVTIL
jgi:hypothetical protein